jgi:enoyl-CoA hydratase
MTDIVTYELESGVATIQMDDGKVNVLSPRMIQSLGLALDRARADQAAVVLAGRTGAFSAGFDRTVLMGNDSAASVEMLLSGFKLGERVLSFPRPVVIACTGHSLAMGAFLMLAGDYRVGVHGAFKIGANEVAIGLTMPRFGVEMCKLRLAPTYLQRSVLNAEIYDPDTAVAAGFLDRLASTADIMSAAHNVASELAKLPAHTFAFTKQRLREDALARLRQAIELDGADFKPGA